MALESDLLLDRRRLKRRLFLWRAIAVLAVIGCVLLVVGRGDFGAVGGPHVTRLSVTGIITENRRLTDAIAALAKDNSVSALIVYVDSPGGSVSGGESLHGAIEKVAAVKPVVTVMGGTAASAGYMISVPAARVFARASTLTGSIGVILETGEVSGLLASLGITAEAIISGPLKDQPSFTHALSPAGREVLHGLVMDLYEQFVAMVATGRHMDPARVRELGDGRAYSGRQALGLGLVDAIGGEPEARDWLAAERHVPAALPVVDLKVGSLAERAFGGGIGSLLGMAIKSVLSQGLRIDGAWSLWQGSVSGN